MKKKVRIKIILLNATNEHCIPTQEQFQYWVNTTIQSIPNEKISDCRELNIRIVDKIESISLNKIYRHKKGPTNVLSFHYDPIPGIPCKLLGELAICADLVKEEATAQDKTLEAHWAHLTTHGVLHLLGYDHVIEKDAQLMENLEIYILQQLGFPNPYTADLKANQL